MRLTIAFLIAVSCFAQAGQNVATPAGSYRDDRLTTWLAPSKTRAALFALTASAHTNERYTVTDCTTSSCTVGGGTIAADFRSDGTSWVMVSGAGGSSSQASIFSGGTKVQRSVECTAGTVTATTLRSQAAGLSAEITILANQSGDTRFDQVLVSETTIFAGGTGLTVSMGRPGDSDHDELTGTAMPLQVSSGDGNYWSSRPIPPQLGTTYPIVLNFAVTSGNVNGISVGGVLTWEVCAYAAR